MASPPTLEAAPAIAAENPRERIEQLLSKNATKALVSALDDGQKAQRTALAALMTACAYVCIAAFGHDQSQHATKSRTDQMGREVEGSRVALESARKQEQLRFNEHCQAEFDTEKLDARSAVAAKATTITEKQREVDQKAQQTAQEARKQAKARHDAEVWVAQKNVDKALVEVAKAQEAVDDFKRNDRKSRPVWDLRSSVVSPELSQAVDEAGEQLALRQRELERVRAVGASDSKTASAPGIVPPDGDSLDRDLQHQKEILKDMEPTRLERVRAQHEWQRSQRELEATQLAYAAAKAELDRLRQEPAPLNLPALGLGVKPSVFLAVAPVLLLILYLRFAGRERTLARMRKDLVAMARAFGVEPTLLAACIPALDSSANSWPRRALVLLPDLTVIGSLALLGFNPEWTIPCIAALVALVAAVAFRVPLNRST